MRAAATVMLTAPNGELVIVRPGEEFPEWAEVTNPHAIAGREAEAAPDEGESPDEDKPADKPAPAKRTTRATKPAPTE